VGRRFDPDRAHQKIPTLEAFIKSEIIDLNVYITHFVPPKVTFVGMAKSFILPRLSAQYFRSWARLIRYGHRGFQPWKKDVMTGIRDSDQLNRNMYLVRVLQSLSDLKLHSLRINIITNSLSIQEFIEDMGFPCTIEVHVFSKYNQMNHLHNSPWDEKKINSPWYLVWEHKEILRKDFLNSNVNSMFLYLENDMLFTQKNLDYWILNFEKLNSKNLIPSFVRVEYSKQFKNWCAIDNLKSEKIKASECNSITEGNSIYLQLPNTYCAIYLLNYELAREYVNSDAISPEKSKKLIWWDLGARSAMGLQFINCPAGFTSRHVVELDKDYLQINNGALLHHLPNLYINNSELGHNFIPLRDLITN